MPESNPPFLSIIILTKNAGERLANTLEAVFKNLEGLTGEVIAIDSGSTDNTRSILSRYPVRLIEIPPASFSHGGTRNLAAQAATGEFLVFLTQDAVPADRNWLKHLIKPFNDETVAGAYGRQLPEKDSSAFEKFFLSYLYPDTTIVKASIEPTNCLLSDIFFSNVNSAIRKNDWEDTKFNETLIMSEDQEWSKSMLLKGRKIVYEPAAAVIHSHRYSFASIISRNFDSGMSLKGIVNAPVYRSLGYEFSYLKKGFLFLLHNGYYAQALFFPLYETARMLGFALGFFSQHLPVWLKKYISQNKTYWS